MEVPALLLLAGAVTCAALAARGARAERVVAVATGARPPVFPLASARSLPARMSVLTWRPAAVLVGGLGLLGGTAMAGPALGVPVAAAGVALVVSLRRRAESRRIEVAERQMGEVVEVVRLALGAGLSVPQALEAAAADVGHPMRPLLERALAEHRLGAPLEEAVTRYAEALGTDDARLFAVLLAMQTRRGGDLTAGLEEIRRTLRHRAAVRREVRALTAQGRTSGAVLVALPVAFLAVLAAVASADLEAAYSSPVGVAMLLSGLALEAAAFVWIRRLLRIEV